MWVRTNALKKIRNDRDDNEVVYAFINQETRTWNHDLIDEVFLSNEAAVIKSIPISILGA